MRFLVDADLPRRTAKLIQSYGHEAIDVRDIGMGTAHDAVIAAHAQNQSACLITGDGDFADIRNYPPQDYGGLVVLELPRDATATFILKLIESLLQPPNVLVRLPGRLAILEPGRIRLRPALSNPRSPL